MKHVPEALCLQTIAVRHRGGWSSIGILIACGNWADGRGDVIGGVFTAFT